VKAFICQNTGAGVSIFLGLLILASGCASHQAKIRFSDDAEIRAETAQAAAQSARAGIDPATQLAVEQLVYGYLLEQHSGDMAGYSAVFLQADDAQVAAMMKKYPNHNPPIKPGSRALIRSRNVALDKDTKKPAMILSVEINDPNDDGSVDAIGRWYAGNAATGFHTFHLAKVGDHWQIADVK
jgi:hypothetical protein